MTFRRRLRSLQRHAGPPEGQRILDVGAYIGLFLEEAIGVGWDAWGLEPSRWAVSYARERGLNVVQGTLEEADFEPESFDALTMWDVIEHLHDPRMALRASCRLLKPDGWIAVHTMNLNSLFARLMGARWPWLMEMHLHFFTLETLRTILEDTGFRVARIRLEGRYLRIEYVATRIRPYSPFLASVVDWSTRLCGLNEFPLYINFGDLVTAYAQKPRE